MKTFKVLRFLSLTLMTVCAAASVSWAQDQTLDPEEQQIQLEQQQLQAYCEAFAAELQQRVADMGISMEELEYAETANEDAKYGIGRDVAITGVAGKAAMVLREETKALKEEHKLNPAKNFKGKFRQWFSRFRKGSFKWTAYAIFAHGILSAWSDTRTVFVTNGQKELYDDLIAYYETCEPIP